MKFSIISSELQGARLGLLNNIKKECTHQIETPTILLHTQGGQIPHLTHEVFKLVNKSVNILQLPLVNMHIYKDICSNYNGSLAQFIGSENSLTCLTLHDPGEVTKQGHHVKDKIPVFTKSGKTLYDADMYMNAVESFKPDMYYLLADSDTSKSSPQKRIVKAVDNTVSLSKRCFERHKKSEALANAFLMAPIAGGYCLKSREKCMTYLQDHMGDELGGFLIDGLHNNGPDVELFTIEDVADVVQCIMKNLPREKLFTIQGCWNPLTVVRLVRLGVDVFDSSYCYVVTERGSALTFALNQDDEEKEDSIHCNEINLHDTKFAEDFSPIMSSCTCVTCRKYTRSYIHHLLIVNELLAPVLLMMHNLHHYLRFFETIRQCISEKSMDDLEKRIAKQYKHLRKSISCV